MIVAINFANKKFRNAQKLNTKTAYKFGADKVIEYSPENIDDDFLKKNERILSQQRGCGYWLWKPYFILSAILGANDGDYIVYSDSGAAYVNNISYLINILEKEKTDIMCFSIDQLERKWNKRDALLLLDGDKDEIINSNQICAGYIIVKKTDNATNFIKEFLYYAQDERIITDVPNQMGLENYAEFRDHRHDQSIWSVLCKKKKLLSYRDPSQFGMRPGDFPIPEDVLERSEYPQIFESHRKSNIKYFFELQIANKWYQRIMRFVYHRMFRIIAMIKTVMHDRFYK